MVLQCPFRMNTPAELLTFSQADLEAFLTSVYKTLGASNNAVVCLPLS